METYSGRMVKHTLETFWRIRGMATVDLNGKTVENMMEAGTRVSSTVQVFTEMQKVLKNRATGSTEKELNGYNDDDDDCLS